MHTMAVNSSYLGCAEPSWASAVPEPQLRGMLTLASLMSETVYLSDVHVGDNENFLQSFRRNRPLGLYAQLKELTSQGIVKYLLRDASVRPATDSRIEISSFVDVYNSWLKQDSDKAWIVPPGSEDRAAFLRDLDSWVPSAAIERYDYLNAKKVFIDTARAVGSSEAGLSWMRFGNSDASSNLRRKYDLTLTKDWFSLSDIYALFQSAGYTSSAPAMLIHGLLNEVAYSRVNGSSLIGADLHDVPLEDIFWPGRASVQESDTSSLPSVTPVEAVLEQAHRVLESPDLSVVALLSSNEVLTLRHSAGQSYFDLLNLAIDKSYISAQTDFEQRLASVTADYWQAIADHIARYHTGAAQRPRKLAIFLGRLPGGLGRASRRIFSFAINVGLPAASALPIPGAGSAAAVAQAATKGVSLRFLFVAETEELQRIRLVVPNRSWLTKSNALVLPDAR